MARYFFLLMNVCHEHMTKTWARLHIGFHSFREQAFVRRLRLVNHLFALKKT